MTERSPWAVIVGRTNDDKPKVIDRVIKRLRRAGLNLGGVIERQVVQRREVIGYDALSVATGQRTPLARLATEPDICPFSFVPEAFGLAHGWTVDQAHDVVFLEAGKLEARGEGLWPTFQHVAREANAVAVAAVHPRFAATIAFKLADPLAGLELPATRGEINAFADQIVAASKRLRGA